MTIVTTHLKKRRKLYKSMTTENTGYDYDNPNSHFGGIIRAMDFNTMYPVSHDIAKRIVSDWNFDRQCKKNEEERNKKMKWRQTDEKAAL